jgi:hypothetical protein
MINAVAVAQEFYRAMGAGVPGHTPGTSEGAEWWKVDIHQAELLILQSLN